MPCLSVSNYASFLKTQLNIHILLTENHGKMQGFLEGFLAKPCAGPEASLKTLLDTLKQAERMNQKEAGALVEHQASLQSFAEANVRFIGYSNNWLLFNGQQNLHVFLEARYLRMQNLLARISSDWLLQNRRAAQKSVEIFGKYLRINQRINKIVLGALNKISAAWEGGTLSDQGVVDVPGSIQFYNLIAYCNRWGSKSL